MKQEGGRLTIKSEPGVEPEKVVISAIVPSEEAMIILYCVKESEEQSDCETIGSESDIDEIDKTEVHNIIKELAELKRKEAECFDKFAKAVPDIQEDNEVVVVAEKVRGSKLPQCIYQMNQRIANPRDFCAALAAGERLYSLYKFNQTGSTPISIPELCNYYDIGKMKIYELLHGESTSILSKKRQRRNLYEESDWKKLKRSPQQRRARRPRLPPPLKQQFVRTHKFTVLFRTTNSSQRKYELKS